MSSIRARGLLFGPYMLRPATSGMGLTLERRLPFALPGRLPPPLYVRIWAGRVFHGVALAAAKGGNLISASEPARLLSDLERARRRWPRWPLPAAFAIGLAMTAPSGPLLYALLPLLVLAMAPLAYLDWLTSAQIVIYHLGTEERAAYASLITAAREIERSGGTARIVKLRPAPPWRRQGGLELERAPAAFRFVPPRFLRCNLPLLVLKLEGVSFCFLPDRLLRISGEGMQSLAYEKLVASCLTLPDGRAELRLSAPGLLLRLLLARAASGEKAVAAIRVLAAASREEGARAISPQAMLRRAG